MPASASSRLAYVDWMRGLACLLMFQTHCYDSWLGGDARKTTFFMWSQLGGTLPAPLFLFLAGISFALVTEKLQQERVARPADCAHHNSPWCGNSWAGAVVSPTGIFDCMGLGAVERSVSRGHPQHHRPLDDADGVRLLDRIVLQPRASHPSGFGCDSGWRRCDDFVADPAALDELAPALAALAA